MKASDIKKMEALDKLYKKAVDLFDSLTESLYKQEREQFTPLQSTYELMRDFEKTMVMEAKTFHAKLRAVKEMSDK